VLEKKKKKKKKRKKKKKKKKKKKAEDGNGEGPLLLTDSEFELITSWWDWLCPTDLSAIDEATALERLRLRLPPIPPDLLLLGKEVLSTVVWFRPLGMERRKWSECAYGVCCMLYVVW